ncbi:MAG: hypothetical protein ACI9O6_003354 [Glaciecola sp.]|jgi:hypothetical protein
MQLRMQKCIESNLIIVQRVVGKLKYNKNFEDGCDGKGPSHRLKWI